MAGKRILLFGLMLVTFPLWTQAQTAQTREVNVIFSPAPYKQSHLEQTKGFIDRAAHSIDIAMYSLSRSTDLIGAIKAARQRQIPVRILLQDAASDRLKPENSLSSQLEDFGVDVRYINKIMHHKFALIDARGRDQAPDMYLISGSANWTGSAATVYDENTIFIRNDRPLIAKYRQEFDYLWAHSRDFVWAPIESDLALDPLPLVDQEEAAADAHFTSANFKVTQSRYGAGFSVVDGANTVSDEIVRLIRSARTSIKIASGHYRSRAIAQAVREAKQLHPDLDVRVYLDGQEYISYSTQQAQKREQDQCLSEAKTAAAIEACFDNGYYYSFEAQAAGIALRFKSYAYRMVATGSYNFSDNAEHGTMENMMVLSADHDKEAIAAFVRNFESMWSLNREALAPLLARIETVDVIPLVFPSMSLEWPELTNLKQRLAAACSLINSPDYRKFPEKHTSCPRDGAAD
jgi:phosphatidylserine/phosphatidylglycerophosphate/cardiolipin synthase-like enzyme